METEWDQLARDLAASIAEVTGVKPRERWLNDRLLEFVFDPNDRASAAIEMVASADELILCAGRGARMELDSAEHSSDTATKVARAVAAGHLTERVRHRRVRFVIDLGDGEKVSGSATLGQSWPSEADTTYHYRPYLAAKSEDGE